MLLRSCSSFYITLAKKRCTGSMFSEMLKLEELYHFFSIFDAVVGTKDIVSSKWNFSQVIPITDTEFSTPSWSRIRKTKFLDPPYCTIAIRRQHSTKFLNKKRDLTLQKDFDALNSNPGSEFTLYTRLLRYSDQKVRKTQLFALFGVMWYRGLIFFRKTGKTVWKYQSCPS